MSKNKKITMDLANGSFKHLKAMPRIEKPAISLHTHLQNKIAELERELVVTKFRLSERQAVLDAIPECPVHGKNCVPHALDWIREGVSQAGINSNNKKAYTIAGVST